MPSIQEVAKERLSADDEVLFEYRGKLDGNDGALLITKEKLLFISEKGLFKKSYNFHMDTTHNELTEMVKEGGELKFKLANGDVHGLKTYRLSFDIITFEYNQAKDGGKFKF
jgi:hypothetical protein